MRQVEVDQVERLLRCAAKVVDIPVPVRTVIRFMPDTWFKALRDLASAVNDIRYGEVGTPKVIGTTKGFMGRTALLVEFEE